jgi:hypothetical protein
MGEVPSPPSQLIDSVARPVSLEVDTEGSDRRGGTLQAGKGADMTDKSPRKTASKKSGKSLKEKRQVKKDKEQTRKGLIR